MSSINSAHDALFRKVLENPASLMALLREHAPAEFVADFAGEPKLLEATSVDGDTLGRTTSDGQVEVPIKSAAPWFSVALLEHKSDPEPRVLLTMLKRVLAVWDDYVRDDARRMQALPMVYLLLFYHGAKPWEVPESLEVTVPYGDGWLGVRLRVIGVNLPQRPAGQLSSDPFAQAAFYEMLYASGHLAGFDALVEAMRQMPDDVYFAKPLLTYILNFEKRAQVEAAMQIAKSKEGGDIMRTGAQEFRAEGIAQAVEWFLQQKSVAVPQAVRNRLAAGSDEELRAWSIKLFRGESLEAVFGADAR